MSKKPTKEATEEKKKEATMENKEAEKEPQMNLKEDEKKEILQLGFSTEMLTFLNKNRCGLKDLIDITETDLGTEVHLRDKLVLRRYKEEVKKHSTDGLAIKNEEEIPRWDSRIETFKHYLKEYEKFINVHKKDQFLTVLLYGMSEVNREEIKKLNDQFKFKSWDEAKPIVIKKIARGYKQYCREKLNKYKTREGATIDEVLMDFKKRLSECEYDENSEKDQDTIIACFYKAFTRETRQTLEGLITNLGKNKDSWKDVETTVKNFYGTSAIPLKDLFTPKNWKDKGRHRQEKEGKGKSGSHGKGNYPYKQKKELGRNQYLKDKKLCNRCGNPNHLQKDCFAVFKNDGTLLPRETAGNQEKYDQILSRKKNKRKMEIEKEITAKKRKDEQVFLLDKMIYSELHNQMTGESRNDLNRNQTPSNGRSN